MNKWEKELAKLELKGEADVLEEMRGHYEAALSRVYEKIDALSERGDLPGIRQRKFQEALAEQIGSALDELRSGAFSTLEGYLEESYRDGFIGSLYSLQRQDIPLLFPIDQESMARAVSMTAGDVKLSKRVYSNVDKLQQQVIAEITRGFADASHVTQIAERMASESDIAAGIKRNVEGRTNQAFRRSMTIARTEKGRVKAHSALESMLKAKAAGADIVKQWDSTMDKRTRKDHVAADGQIRELDEDFIVGGHRGPSPHMMGAASQDVNCRCVCLQRARAALEWDDKSTKWDGDSQCYADLSDAENYGVFKTAWQIKDTEHGIGLLGKRIAGYNKQAAALEGKSYSGIWRDPVSVSDYASKAGSVKSKREYFDAHMSEDPGKFSALKSRLGEFEENGKKYEKLTKKRASAQAELAAKRRDLAKLKGEEYFDDPFGQERKDAAHSFKTAKEADKLLRATSGKTWKDATDAQRRALYDYTSGSGSFNRPLAGFEKPWMGGGSGFEQQYYKGPGSVWIDYEGRGGAIRDMTDAIGKSTYDFDMWLNRGCDANAIESFLGIGEGKLSSMSNEELQQYVSRSGIFHNFVSTGVADGTGFTDKLVEMRIYAPGGTEMIYAEPFSSYGLGGKLNWDGLSGQKAFGSEAEMIVQRGASYMVSKIERRGGRIYIELEIHPEAGYDKFQQNGKWSGSKGKFK